MSFKLLCLCAVVGVVIAQDYQDYNRPAPSKLQSIGQKEVKPTPIPILKQINRHNEDGSYTYGYEGADGSFKIETKLATGEVKGKYGYVDESSGKVRVVEYGANKYGFQPSGEGITVAPPTLVDESTNKDGLQIDYDEEQQQQQYQPIAPQKTYVRPQPKAQPRPQPQQAQYHYEQQQQLAHQPQQQQPQYVAPRFQQPAQFANAEDVYSARPRPSRPESDHSQQQAYIPTPQVEEDEYESIGRGYQQQPQQHQPQQSAYTAPRAGSLFTQAQPQHQRPVQQIQPQEQHQPQQYSRPASSQQGRGGSVLDQLAKDFALPAGGSPALHDITYTYY